MLDREGEANREGGDENKKLQINVATGVRLKALRSTKRHESSQAMNLFLHKKENKPRVKNR